MGGSAVGMGDVLSKPRPLGEGGYRFASFGDRRNGGKE